jgi:hypothetical protein
MTLYSAFATFIDQLENRAILESGVLRWACPVPYFGQLSTARIATVGINPSVREFTTIGGRELTGDARRFPTIHSLQLSAWSQADASHIIEVARACNQYFRANPYRRWFGVLENVIRNAGGTYFGESPTACHIDLVPYATTEKWGALAGWQRQQLLRAAANLVGQLVSNSPIKVLVLNGQTVVRHFSDIASVTLSTIEPHDWRLPGGTRGWVRGIGYIGATMSIGDVGLDAPITVVGFNHNLQSSFGVTRLAVKAIGRWLASEAAKPSE